MHGPDDDQLESINASIADWEQTRDEGTIRKLDEILSPDLLFRRADKSVIGKHEFIAALSGPSPFATRESEHAVVEVRGDRALVTLTVATTKADGTKNRYRNVRMFVRRDGRWLLEFWFNDDVTQIPGL
jgi:ketosteroid isomerase-like protein